MTSHTFIVRRHSQLVTGDDGAEGFSRIGHESLNLLHSARDAGKQLDAISCHGDVIFNANLPEAVTQTSVEH